MNFTTWLLLVCCVLMLAGLVWAGCTWWYRRKLNELQQRLEKTRFAASQFAGQTRRQIGQLQRELSERPPLSATQRKARDEAAEAAARKQALVAELDGTASTKLPTNGFADTQPL